MNSILFGQFITMQEFGLVSQFLDELPPGTAHAQVVIGQRAQAAWIGFGRDDLVRPIFHGAQESAVGIVDEDKFAHGSMMSQHIKYLQ